MTTSYEPERELAEILKRADGDVLTAILQLAKLYLIEIRARDSFTGRIELHVKDGRIRLHKCESVTTWE